MDFGSVTLALAVIGVLAWLTFLVTQIRVRRRREPAPQNLSPFLTDDELESKRLSRVLVSALVATGILAIVMPVYYLNESSRQAAAAETFHEIAVERGHHWYEEFQCGDCHGLDGGGGGAAFIEPRSGISTTWAAPSLNDILYRYDSDEVLFWITYGRQGTPMPAWGTEGGGPMNIQQLEELLAYIESLQITQGEAVAAVDGAVSREISRLNGADETAARIEADLQATLNDIYAAADRYGAVQSMPERLADLLSVEGTCTEETAGLVRSPCDAAGPDEDRDGISDRAEAGLMDLIAELLEHTPPSSPARAELDRFDFDPANPFTTTAGSTPVPDLDQVDGVIAAFETVERDLRLTLENSESLTASTLTGLEYVEQSAADRLWAIDIETIAATDFDGNVSAAQRGAALYNAYCARCHTAGYSAGVTFTQEAGSGGFGPSLRDGRSSVQFPDEESHLDFIINGSANGQLYGLNGVGRGWMPGFGAVLSEDDLRLIVKFERALR